MVYDTGDTRQPYVICRQMPKIEGVVVVAQGGGNAKTVTEISNAVMSLFPVEAHKVVVKMSVQDAGKTTLTEKFLLYGGAINQAGSVKGKQLQSMRFLTGWRLKKKRGISVTSSVLQFNYDGYCINILDTPGHQDFSEDTYRTLMAADSAVMVIDASKGVEAQTRKLFKVCTMRHIPIFTFINKMDREAMDTFELLDDIENIDEIGEEKKINFG